MGAQGTSTSRYEAWVTNLKAVQGTIRKRILGAFASVLGDKTTAWVTQAVLEHMPSFASDQGVELIASERQLDTAAGEAASSIAARAPYWLQLAKFYGSGLGVLLGLHFSGFDGAVVVQQNGVALQLTLPLPPFVLGQAWDPTPNLVETPCNVLGVALTSNVTPPTTMQAGRSIPSGNSWFAFDSNTDFCSRMAVLFPTAPSNYPFSAADLARLQSTIQKWRPAKATCLGVFVCTAGVFAGWPVRHPNTPRTRPGTVVNTTGSF